MMFADNPDLVQELIDGRWSMDQDEFEEKYFSLSYDDRTLVDEVIDNMNNEPIPGIDTEDEEDDDESIDVYTAAEIWVSSGFDEDQMFGFTVDELRAALS